MTKLAALHALDASALALPAFPAVATVAAAVDGRTRRVGAGAGGAGRDARSGSRLLAPLAATNNIPAYDGPPVLVQGDTGPGNFMYAGGRVTAVVDWELAHLGDPMDDIAWLSLRATQEPSPTSRPRLREYEALSGNVVDEGRVRYYQVMAETKLQVMSHRGPRDETADGRRGRWRQRRRERFHLPVLHRRMWLEALAAANDLQLTPAEPPRPDSLVTATGCTTPSSLSSATSSFLGRRTLWRRRGRRESPGSSSTWLGSTPTAPYYEECELQDLATLLGQHPHSVMSGRADAAAEVAAGTVTEEDYILTLWRRIARETELARSVHGRTGRPALADRCR